MLSAFPPFLLFFVRACNLLYPISDKIITINKRALPSFLNELRAVARDCTWEAARGMLKRIQSSNH